MLISIALQNAAADCAPALDFDRVHAGQVLVLLLPSGKFSFLLIRRYRHRAEMTVNFARQKSFDRYRAWILIRVFVLKKKTGHMFVSSVFS